MPESSESDFIVLRKVMYGENALILTGISPEFGRIGFLVHGAAGGKRRAFPELDLFRLLHVRFLTDERDLHRIQDAELLEDFGTVSSHWEHYQAACWLAQFSCVNVMPNLPHPHYANALEVALRRLARAELLPEAILTGACMAFIFEEGWLAHAVTTPEATEQCREILMMAAGNPPPAITDDSWRKQFAWTRQILLLNDCKLPD